MNAICRGCGILGLLLLCSIHSLNGQGAAKRVTAATTKGDLVEGVLKGATEGTITVEVAGQQVQIPIDTLQYLSFVGPLATRTEKLPAVSNSMEGAFAAIAELQTATEVGVLRTQWADRLLAAVPRIRTFTQSADANWPDVKAALEMAVSEYRGALDNWQAGSIYFEDGARAARYAKDLAAKPEEEHHKEAPAPQKELPFGTPAFGRLGFGDAVIPDGRYAEVFSLSVGQKINVAFALDCIPVSGGCTSLVTGADGKPIELVRDYRDSSVRGFRTTKPLQPGIYVVQVTTSHPGYVGQYKITASALK